MRFATVRVDGDASTRAVRIDGDRAVELDAPDVGALLALRGGDVRETGAVRPVDTLDYAPLVPNPGKIVCLGLNYRAHILETGRDLPTYPTLFAKYADALVGARDPVVLPPEVERPDWEVELAFVIGRTARYVPVDQALRYVAGYCIVNDVSERDFQLKKSATQWNKGKGCDTFGPMGPWLVTTDEIRDPQNLDMWLDVNGERRQTGNTRTMIFDVATLVADVSKYMTLLPGDVITTGTPPGVGLGMKPPVWLKPGDVMTLGIAGLGEQKQKVVPFKAGR